MKLQVELDSFNACRTNTGRARKNDGHYDLDKLSEITGFKPKDEVIKDLQWCAENRETEAAHTVIIRLAESLLAAYEIQAETYKNKK